MTSTSEEIQHTEDYAVAEAHAVDKASPRQYWMIALILAVVTAVEVAVAYIEALGNWLVPILFVLAIAKFALVVGYFMHLKYDSPAFQRMFIIGVVGAIVLFLVMLGTFHAIT